MVRALLGLMVFAALAAGCGDTSGATGATAFSGFDGCEAGAESVMAFLQRTLDEIGGAESDELATFAPDFDEGVHALLLRAREVHCTEEGFNNAIVARVGELKAHGSAAELLVEAVGERGLGSLEESRGGPIELPAD